MYHLFVYIVPPCLYLCMQLAPCSKTNLSPETKKPNQKMMGRVQHVCIHEFKKVLKTTLNLKLSSEYKTVVIGHKSYQHFINI